MTKFEIGDEVKIIGSHYKNGDVGRIGTITDIEDRDTGGLPWANVAVSGLPSSWAVALRDLELVVPVVTDEEVQDAIRSILQTDN